ncbi:MAG: response regulator transcription factor [Lachnospiraceae bacterium]|nr:response regulator transcription factor [Lachnospiraceae bacterium]
MKKKILIVEDNPRWLKRIEDIVSLVSWETEIFAASDLRDAYEFAMGNSIDLFIVDIILNSNKLGDVSGMEFAENIRLHAKYRYTPIIFITSLEDIKLRAYSNIHCYSYIEKPFDDEKTGKIIEEALDMPLKKENEREYFYYRKDGVLYGYYADDILYFKNCNHKIVLYSIHETVTLGYRSMNSLLSELDTGKFIQCNRNTIINRRHIEYIDPLNRFVKLRNVDEQLEIGIVLKNKFLSEMQDD